MSGTTYYKHILAAIDLSEDNRKVIDKAVDRARSTAPSCRLSMSMWTSRISTPR